MTSPQRDRFVPNLIEGKACGIRREIADLLDLVDTSDPAFPHIAAALQETRDAGIDLDEASVSIAVKIGQHRHAQSAKQRDSKPDPEPIVYYVRRGEFIKIGTTTQPYVRLAELLPDEVLAYEPGGLDLERRRHAQFAAHRINRRWENFRPAPPRDC